MRGETLTVSLDEGPWLYRSLAAVSAALVWPFVRIVGHNLGVADRTRTAVVIANHRSFFDVAVALVVFRRLGRYPRVIVASNWFEGPVTGRLLRLAGAIPIDRTDPALHLAAARRVLGAGIPIVILPEGTLSGEPGRPTTTGEFKTGAARIAAHCGAGVWPVAIVGSDDVWPKGATRPRFGWRTSRHVLLHGHDHLLAVDGDDPRVATDRLRGTVTELLEEAVALHPVV